MRKWLDLWTLGRPVTHLTDTAVLLLSIWIIEIFLNNWLVCTHTVLPYHLNARGTSGPLVTGGFLGKLTLKWSFRVEEVCQNFCEIHTYRGEIGKKMKIGKKGNGLAERGVGQWVGSLQTAAGPTCSSEARWPEWTTWPRCWVGWPCSGRDLEWAGFLQLRQSWQRMRFFANSVPSGDLDDKSQHPLYKPSKKVSMVRIHISANLNLGFISKKNMYNFEKPLKILLLSPNYVCLWGPIFFI